MIISTRLRTRLRVARVRKPIPKLSSSRFRSSLGASWPVPRISSQAHQRLDSHSILPLDFHLWLLTPRRPTQGHALSKSGSQSKPSRGESLRALQEQIEQLSDQVQHTQRENMKYQKQIQTAVDKTSHKLAFSLPAAQSLNPAASPFNYDPTPPYRSSRPSHDDYESSPRPNTPPPDSNSDGESPPPGAPPQTNREWLQYMMDERRASEDKMLQMFTQLGQNHSQVDKSIPQVQPMSKDEDLT